MTTPDAIRLKGVLDKAQTGADENALLSKVQNRADDLIDRHGDDKAVLFSEIEKTTSGEEEKLLKKETNARLTQIKEQEAQIQRKFINRGKVIVDESSNYTEAIKSIVSFTSQADVSLETSKSLRAYANDRFLKTGVRKVSDPFAMNEAFVLVNKNRQGTANPTKNEVIENVEQLIVRFSPRTTPGDMQKIVTYWNNGGSFNKTGYDMLLQSFSSMNSLSKADLIEDKDKMGDFNRYLDFVIPVLPSDKAINPLDLNKLTSAFLLEDQSGETLRPGSSIFETGLFSDKENENLEDADKAGRGGAWLPVLDEEKEEEVKKMIALENEDRRERNEPLIEDSELSRQIFYKQMIMLRQYIPPTQ